MIVAGSVALLALVAVIGIYLGIRAVSDPYHGRILGGVQVAGVDVGGMTKSQAVSAVKAAVANSYKTNDMIVKLPDTDFYFRAKETGASLNVRSAVNAAYNYGRSGGSEQQKAEYAQARTEGYVVPLQSCLNLKEDVIRNALESYASHFEGTFVPSGFTLEGEMPALDEESFDPSVPCQTLVLTTGTPGFTLDMDQVFRQILDAYDRNTFLVDLSDGVTMDTPMPLNLKAVASQICVDPVDAAVDLDGFTAIPGSYGYAFDIDAAEKMLSTAGYGESVQLPMQYIAPKLLGDEVYFQDELAFALSPHSTSENRNANLRLACAALNGTVIQPGKNFSYNQALGQRTEENGYLSAPAYSGMSLVDTVGGGICQVSSTLYMASLFAELEIVERINHGYPVSYIPAGLDATVNWESPDLVIKNSSPLPVKILAEESDGFVKIRILGTETRDYTVKMEFRANGHYARTYRCRFSNLTGELISREDICISTYISDSMSAVGAIGSGQAYVNGNVQTPVFNTAP